MSPFANRRRAFARCRVGSAACIALLLSVAAFSQTPPAPGANPAPTVPDAPPIVLKYVGPNAPGKFDPLFPRTFLRYTVPDLQPMTFMDMRRPEWLIVAGQISLTVQEAIALAIDNNLDVESVRLLRPIARADLARAKSGQLLRTSPSGVNSNAQTPQAVLGAPQFTPQGTPPPFGGVLNGLTVQLLGSEIPDTEPTLFASGRVDHTTQPLENQTFTGTNSLNSKEEDWQVGIRKGFLTGTTVTAQFESLRTSNNAPFYTINPALAGDISITATQHLLRGFGRQTNSRTISISRNNSKVADLNFRIQVEQTVAQVLGLYYDLVATEDEIQLADKAIDRHTARLKELQHQMDEGMAAQADVISAEMDLETGQQALSGLRSQMLDQETLLKSLLTRSGLEELDIVRAHIVPTDRFAGMSKLADADPFDVAERAVEQRPEIARGQLTVDNEHLGLLGTRNALLPTLDVYVKLQNNALAGQLNPLAPANIVSQANNGFVGGFGTMLDQLATRTYPDYEAGFQLNMPLANRAAQADLARHETDLRQQEISLQMLRNSIRLQAMRSVETLKQARAQYELSVKARKLAENNLDTEQKMFALGTSDPIRLETSQSGLERTQLREVVALNAYARAHVALEAILNQTLEDNGITIDEPTAAKQ
jgi:outer membrane protein